MYTVGIKRRFLPGYRRFKVEHHEHELVGASIRLVLQCADKSIVAIPHVADLGVKIFPDYDYAVTMKQRAQAEVAAIKEEAKAELIAQAQQQQLQRPLAPVPIPRQ